jgi:hypothetical protein
MSHLILPPIHPPTPRLINSSTISVPIIIPIDEISPDLISVTLTLQALNDPIGAVTIPTISNGKISKTYEEIKETLRPFDLVFFKGSDFVSNSIRNLQKLNNTSGDFSHVGMVINSDVLSCIKNSQPNKWYIWESTMSGQWNDGIPDIETGEGYFGTQFRSLDAVVDAYSKNPNTEIAFSSLFNNPIIKKDDESNEIYTFRIQQLKKQLQDTYEQFNHRIYDANLVNLIATIVPFCRCFRNCTRNESFFCSELVSIIYKKIGIFPWYLNEEDITPETLLSRRFIIKNYIRNEAKSLYQNDELPGILQYPPIYVINKDV